MPDAGAGDGLRLCRSDALAERGKAVLFDVRHFREQLRAFVLRFEGEVFAYVNRCAHVPTEMDWQEGEFFDGDREYLICSIHGAMYQPQTGRCVAGPCTGARLIPLVVREKQGEVYWYPSADTRPVFSPET